MRPWDRDATLVRVAREANERAIVPTADGTAERRLAFCCLWEVARFGCERSALSNKELKLTSACPSALRSGTPRFRAGALAA
jgi:hypothetical protein